MQSALKEFGENVNLLRDLIVCQYHTQDMAAFRAGLAHLELVLVEQEARLSSRSLIESELLLGKFLEEEARLAPALLFYERVLKRATDPQTRLRALIQKTRWMALYEPGGDLSSLYRELLGVSSSSLNQDAKVELTHSLMLIELRLIGADHALCRWQKPQLDLQEVDQRLLFFDFVEGCLSQDLQIPAAVQKLSHNFKNLDPYEEFLRQMLQGGLEGTQKIDALVDLASKVSWSSYLRLLCLSANREEHGPIREELNRKLELLLQGLDSRSQGLWNSRLKYSLQKPEITIDLSLRSRALRIHGRVIDLSKKKIGLQLIASLAGQADLSVDQAMERLWQADFSPEHYHRLRMSTHRLNTLIHEATGLGKIVEVDSQAVRLRPDVKLICRENEI
jgi:hypothetical protein